MYDNEKQSTNCQRKKDNFKIFQQPLQKQKYWMSSPYLEDAMETCFPNKNLLKPCTNFPT